MWAYTDLIVLQHCSHRHTNAMALLHLPFCIYRCKFHIYLALTECVEFQIINQSINQSINQKLAIIYNLSRPNCRHEPVAACMYFKHACMAGMQAVYNQSVLMEYLATGSSADQTILIIKNFCHHQALNYLHPL